MKRVLVILAVLAATVAAPAGATTSGDFVVRSSPTSLRAAAGTSVSTSIITTVTFGTAQSITLSASGLPAGVTATFAPSTITAGTTSLLTLATSTSTPVTTSVITVTAAGTQTTHTAIVVLTVTASVGGTTNDFSVGANPSSVTVTQGASGTTTIVTAVTSGSAQSVTLAASGLPAGANAGFSPPSVVAGGNSTLTITTSATTPTGMSTIVITATGTSATHTTSVSLTVGSSGGTSNDFSVGANPPSVTVARGASGTTTIVTAVTSGSAQSITLAASGLPTGANAGFSPPSVVAGGSSTLTITTSASTPTGMSTIGITATGTSATHTTTVALTVTGSVGNDFSVGANPPSVTVTQGASGTTTILTAVTSGFTQAVFLSASGLPAGATAGFSPPALAAGSSATLTITTSAATPSGMSTVVITARGTYATHTTSVSLTVGPLPSDFAIAANPGGITVSAGGSGTTTISTNVTSGSPQTVSLGASGLPTGATATFNPTSVTAGAGSTLTISTTTSTAPGTSTVTVTGTGTSATHSTTVSLTVQGAAPSLTLLSRDPFTNTDSQHATEVEPDTLSAGSMIVSDFQMGRFFNGGSSDLGFATSADGGTTWTNGVLPGVTVAEGGPSARASDPSVAFDPKHGNWLIASLLVDATGTGRGVMVSRASDGVHWGAPVLAVSSTSDYLDKSWIVCDTTSTSPDYGNCYVEFDDNSQGNHIYMLTSTDGGVTWSAPRSTADSAFGLGGQPLVQPNGTVVVPYFADLQSQIRSFVSTDGGSSWGSSVEVSTQSDHGVDGGLRTEPLPSAEIDAAGTVYLVWQDCRFRTGCQSNDMVLSTSTDGTTWSPVQRVPIDPVNSGEDHFIPGLAVDRTTSGSSAHLGLAYYFYPNAVCSSSTCQLEVGYVSSTNGGVTWSAPTTVAGPMTMNELASTSQGFMVGDYISTSIAGGRAYPVFAVGLPLSGSTFNEAMYTVPGGLPVTGGSAFGSFETGVSPAVTPSVRPPGTAT